MIARRAEERGDIQPGATLIEATSGNTGIALAMAAAVKGYRMILIMPEDLSIERVQTMKAFGAELILTPKSGGMELRPRPGRDRCSVTARDWCWTNLPMPITRAYTYETTGPEIWDAHPRVKSHTLSVRHGHHRHHHRCVEIPQGAATRRCA
jgi:cysteine synthase B